MRPESETTPVLPPARQSPFHRVSLQALQPPSLQKWYLLWDATAARRPVRQKYVDSIEPTSTTEAVNPSLYKSPDRLQGPERRKADIPLQEDSQILKLKQEIVLLAIKNFESLPYRLEKVAEKKKVSYYVDVLATIPEATINSIETLKNVNTLIFGGLDRGINYQTLIDYLQKSTIENLICMPTTGHKIANQLYKKKIFLVNTLEEAVNIAKKVTKENMICLLSPAASSYEQFKNYKEKADKFIELISDQKN